MTTQALAAGRSSLERRPEYDLTIIVIGWRMRKAASAAATRLKEAGEKLPLANKPISNGLKMKTHDPWSCGRKICFLKIVRMG